MNQSAAFLSARTVQTASEMKPQLKKLTTDPAAREHFRSNKACEILSDVADKAGISPENFAQLKNPKSPEPTQATKDTSTVLRNAQNIFEKRVCEEGGREENNGLAKTTPNGKTTQNANDTGSSAASSCRPTPRGFSFDAPNQSTAPHRAEPKDKGKGKNGKAQTYVTSKSGKQGGKESRNKTDTQQNATGIPDGERMEIRQK